MSGEIGGNGSPEKRPLPTKATIEARRTRVSALYERGFSIREIASALGVSVGTVHADVQVVLRRFREEQLGSIEHIRATALHWLAPLHVVVQQIANDPHVRQDVRVRAAAEARAVLMNTLRVLGAMPSEKVELTAPDGGPLFRFSRCWRSCRHQ